MKAAGDGLYFEAVVAVDCLLGVAVGVGGRLQTRDIEILPVGAGAFQLGGVETRQAVADAILLIGAVNCQMGGGEPQQAAAVEELLAGGADGLAAVDNPLPASAVA